MTAHPKSKSKPKSKPKSKARRRARAPRPRARGDYLLRLFVTGASPRSARAIANIKAICENEGCGLYLLEVVDIYQQPELARTAQLLAAPTLVKAMPPPERRLVGDLSDRKRVLSSLGLHAEER
jgi:circadian clock protein KaiB